MDIDPARCDEQAVGIQLSPPAADIRADRGDAAVGDADVRSAPRLT
jgi:hypothetical protein